MDAVPKEGAQSAPRHVAIIMDGNRRWARSCGLSVAQGHAEGVKALFRTVQDAAALGVEVLTVYGFSTENWGRTEKEVKLLLEQIRRALDDYTDAMLREGVKLSTIGDLSGFPTEVRERLEETGRITQRCQNIELVLALNYGGRDDICRAVKKLLKTGAAPDQLDEEMLAKFLDTAQWCDPDLLIRTSGEMRLSNFLLWQLSYAELFVTDVLWPDFNREHLKEALAAYRSRERRAGQ